MPTPPLSEDTLQETIDVWLSAHRARGKAAEALGIAKQTLDHRLKVATRRGMLGPMPQAMQGFEVRSYGEVTGPNGETKSRSVRYGPEAGGQAEIPAGTVHNRGTIAVGPDGRTERHWIKYGPAELSPEHVAKIVNDFVKTLPWTRIKAQPPPNTGNDNLLTIYPLADLHLSLRATADVAGEDYDLERAQALFNEKSAQIIQKSPPGGTALIAYLGDWTHQDDDKNMTPRSGHILEVSSSIYRAVEAGLQLAILHTYRCLSHHDKVKIKVIRGNHDLHSWIGLVLALREHFRNEPRVTVDTSEADYWFCRWGVTLIGLHHGHRMKAEEMAGAMATECAEDWGETLYRLFLHGHLHNRIAKDVLGVLVECMRTIASPDAHHAGKYGSPRSLISITLDKEEGEQSRASVNLKPIRRKAVHLSG